MSYAIYCVGHTFTPDGKVNMSEAETVDHNKAVEARELAHWATKPDRWQVYVKGETVTTWLGTKLGTVYRGHSFRTNLSRNMRAITFVGTNGAHYYGRYGADWSQLCRVKKLK